MTMPRQKPGRSKQDYGTPPELLTAIKKKLHITDFSVDLAASEENHVTPVYITKEDESLIQQWSTWAGWAWCNPPWGDIDPWVAKAALEAQKGAHIVMLVPASVGANWWSKWVEPYAYQVFLNGRLTFVGETTPYPKDCAVLLYTPWQFKGNEVWRWKS